MAWIGTGWVMNSLKWLLVYMFLSIVLGKACLPSLFLWPTPSHPPSNFLSSLAHPNGKTHLIVFLVNVSYPRDILTFKRGRRICGVEKYGEFPRIDSEEKRNLSANMWKEFQMKIVMQGIQGPIYGEQMKVGVGWEQRDLGMREREEKDIAIQLALIHLDSWPGDIGKRRARVPWRNELLRRIRCVLSCSYGNHGRS